MRKKTKIICTMGPATDRDGVLDALIAGGMNCARFNFSHGTHEEQAGRIAKVRDAARKANAVIPLLLDTKGPEMRLGEFAEGKVELTKGSRFVLTADDQPGDASRV
ncbi:MAG: pyruvate kinase, partial [Schwartzia sp.]|nr:pyruvate kinase [Schwartzia sp. (in: firmicutes)]